MKFLLIIGTCLGLASCSKPEHRIVHEIHYIPSYGAIAPTVEPIERINPNMPVQPTIENHRQYPPRRERDNSSDKYNRGF